MKSLNFNRNTAKGFSLIELLLVLGVLAILLVAAFVVYPQVRDRNQANAEVSNLTTIKANINNLYASRGGNYADLNNTIAVQARAFPQNMVVGAATASDAVQAAWGGVVTVNEGATAREFTITYNEVPAGVCLGLVSGAAGNFSQVLVGSTALIPTTGANVGKFDPGAAAGACAAGAAQTVIFTSN